MSLSAHLSSLRVIALHAAIGGSLQELYDTESIEDTQQDEQETPAHRRRVILTDVLGEASFSLRNIRYVIDTGVQLKTVSLWRSGFVWVLLTHEAQCCSPCCSSTDLQPTDPSGFTASAAHQQTAG